MIKPLLHVYQTITQPIQTNQDTLITWDQVRIDTLGVFRTAAGQNTRYYPNIPGLFRSYVQVAIQNPSSGAPGTTGDRWAQFRKNSVETDETPYAGQPAPKVAGIISGIGWAWSQIRCNGTTDYIEAFGGQNSGATLSTFYGGPFTHSFMIIEWVAP